MSTLFATSLIQIAASFAIAAPLAVSVVIVRAEGLPESWIGYYTSLMYASAIIGSVMTAQLMTRFSVRFLQLGALLATGLGYALFSGLTAGLLPIFMAAVGIILMGLSYGLIVPSSALALAERYSQRMQPLVVSVRQTGVPVGTALVALIAPLVAHHYGWQAVSGIVLAVIAVAFALSLPGLRPFAAIGTDPPQRQSLLVALQKTLSDPPTRRLAMIAGAYGINQAALTTYLVPGLVWLHGLSVGKSAGFLAIATLAGAAARIAFGMTTARFGRPSLHLALIGLVSGLAWFLLLSPLPSSTQLTIGSILLGMSAMGWNGILLAEIGLAAPAGHTTEAVATGTSFAYLGVLVAPLAFVQIDHAFNSKTAALAGLATLAVLAGAALLISSGALTRQRGSH